jgi:hypothetical protein
MTGTLELSKPIQRKESERGYGGNHATAFDFFTGSPNFEGSSTF